MPGSVFANGRSILHKDDGGTHVAGVPDVCKTPSPGGPVPVPYPNMAMSSDLSDGTKKVKIQGAMAAHKSAKISKSTGDEPGTVGGVVSNVNRGKMAFALYSMDVKMEGKNAVRFSDMGPGNGNSYNDMYPIVVGGVHMVAYGDDANKEICDKCEKPRPPHRLWATDDAVAACKKWMEKVESISKEIVDARMAWADPMISQLKNAEFSDSGGSNHKLVDVTTAKKLDGLNWKKEQWAKAHEGEKKVPGLYHSSEMEKLAAVTSGVKDLLDMANTVPPPIKALKDASRFLQDSTRMFGVCLCKCRSKTGKQAQAFAAISGQGSSPSTIAPEFDYGAFAKKCADVTTAANVVLGIVTDPKYGLPSIAKEKNVTKREIVEALLGSYKKLAEAALAAIELKNKEAQTAPNDAARYFICWTLEKVADEAITELNKEKGRIYDWHLPAAANLGPPKMPGATSTSTTTKGEDGKETTVTTVSWPDGKYTWNSAKDDSNAPFCCAAPKAIRLCQDKGHVPEALCEILYLGPDGEPIHVNPRTASTKDYDDMSQYTKKTSKKDYRKVDHKEVAAHCDTCQEVVPKMVCDKEGKDCP